MNTYYLLITISFLHILIIFYPAITESGSLRLIAESGRLSLMAQKSGGINNNLFSQSYQRQETTISLNGEELNYPYLLRIETSPSATNLNGKIEINGQVIKTILNSNEVINLSSYLTQGKNTILITGNYSPANSLVTINLQGQQNTVTQTTGGNGQVQQKIVIHVN